MSSKEFYELRTIVQNQEIEIENLRKIIQLLQERLIELADDFDRLNDNEFQCYRRTQNW